MPDLADLKALIHDHEAKDTGLTVDIAMCMKTWLADELSELEAEKGETVAQYAGSMAAPDTAEVDAQIESKRAEVEAATITLHFKALTEPKYREVLREFPINEHTSEDEDAAFLGALAERCYIGVGLAGSEFTAADYPLADIRGKMTAGEMDPIHGEVFALNRGNKSRRPLSPKRSKTNRRT